MGKNKLKHFEENRLSPNLFEQGKDLYGNLGGKWNSHYFSRSQPITLEIGCGKGEYTVGLAEEYPERNFIGIDIKGARLWKGSQDALARNLTNVAFLRTQVELVLNHFAPGEADAIWITFPDPLPRKSDSKRRLVSARFQKHYRELLAPGGVVHFKTDNRMLFEFALEVLAELKINPTACTFDFYNSGYRDVVHGLMTTFEKKYVDLGQPIYYLAYSFD